MSAQPANTSIKVYRAIRSYRAHAAHTTIANRIKRLAPLVMSVPGREGAFTQVVARDTNVTDFSPYMGEARVTALRGYPVVIGTAPQVSYQNAQGNLPGIGFSFQIGQDKFITNTEAGLAGDLHKDARALSPDLA
jgi:hypothetical protein